MVEVLRSKLFFARARIMVCGWERGRVGLGGCVGGAGLDG